MGGDLSDEIMPRAVPEGVVPLWSFEGTAYECGRQYAHATRVQRPGYRRYLDPAWRWNAALTGEARKLIEGRAPHVPDIFRGIADVGGPPENEPAAAKPGACTSFGVHGSGTLDGQPISGQTKDTPYNSAYQYVVLRMLIQDAPDLLALVYPGEVLGYGFWSTGSSIFRNSLHSSAGADAGLTMEQWGFLALAATSVHEAAHLAQKHGMRDDGNCLISDRDGNSLSVEYNVGGVEVIPATDGIATHANHPEGEKTSPYEHYPHPDDQEDSRFRMHGLWERLHAERGRLSAVRCFHLLADHTRYPRGLCRHIVQDNPRAGTSAAVVVEPTRGRLHVTRGNPCCNWPVTYRL